jgi:hypothetical protein
MTQVSNMLWFSGAETSTHTFDSPRLGDLWVRHQLVLPSAEIAVDPDWRILPISVPAPLTEYLRNPFLNFRCSKWSHESAFLTDLLSARVDPPHITRVALDIHRLRRPTQLSFRVLKVRSPQTIEKRSPVLTAPEPLIQRLPLGSSIQ